MVKDKKQIIEKAQKILQTVKVLSHKIFGKIIAKIDEIDPSGNAKQRVMSAAVLVPLAIYAICFSKSLFFFFAIVITILMTAEWLEMIKKAEDQNKWRLIGLAYIAIPMYCVLKLRLQDTNILLWMFAIIWTTDIFAYFSGKIFGGAKMAPTISPNKTWSGLIGGVAATMLIGFMSAFMFRGGVMFFIVVSVLLALIEQASDLLESKFKRIFGIKDSGNIIPGHGGILDRLDGMMLTAPVVLFIITIFSDKF